eukprot:TRINITY_DN10347_c0_g1_i2.p1 TRINITY_DN10347_c0_g1~~TRINITY_DN10347_c0_g1_i2.p1  ORF type:complete len:238 (+),score=41.96 TRINITY_DN10347_c0_g1_i2:82-795(+)
MQLQPELQLEMTAVPGAAVRSRSAVSKSAKETGILPDAEKEFLTQKFRQVAGGGNGDVGITKREASELLRDISPGFAVSDADEAIFFGAIEESQHDNISLSVFLQAILHWYRTENSQLAAPEERTDGDRTPRAGTRFSAIGQSSLDLVHKNLVSETFKKYDKEGTGTIKFDDLRDMMTDLNCGIQPTDQEVQHVMWFVDSRQNGVLDISEFETAVTFWYIHTMEERERSRSHCCTIL